MRIITIKVRCPDTPVVAVHREGDMSLAVESVVSVALLELFSVVEVDGVWFEEERSTCEEPPDHPAW